MTTYWYGNMGVHVPIPPLIVLVVVMVPVPSPGIRGRITLAFCITVTCHDTYLSSLCDEVGWEQWCRSLDTNKENVPTNHKLHMYI